MIQIHSSSRYKIQKKLYAKVAQDYLVKQGVSDTVLVNIIFVGKIKMRQIAKTYKDEDVALPVLAFSYNDKEENEEQLLGEIFICYPQGVLLASERNKTVDITIIDLIQHGIRNLLK
ncbi:MAG: rRNA maturation RNase YbeY [Candidatus Roizmanbacteria bacterium]